MSTTGTEIDDIPSDEFDYEFEGEGYEEFEEEPTVYYSEDFISGPKLSKHATLPGNILEFDFSFGYDCKRNYNITVADENTIIFASGNLINFFNVTTKELTFRRSAFGGGIGHITKNPNSDYPHIAVAENGKRPPIIIYDWPSLEIVCLLKGGTSHSFTHLNYSPDGMLLASQGGEPDFLITIFNWSKSRITLRTKSNVNEVFRVMFSPDVPGQLTTCGLTHIKFWKMAETFTGLKLQGQIGRFGKTEYCDIFGIYPMPDEKVLSGCDWGNILMWDEALIKLEVCRKLRKSCHDGPITQFFYSNGDLWTVGMDGRVRVWFYDTIDQADPPDDDRFVLVEPIYDFETPNVSFMCIYKQNDDPKNSFYYAQDGNGGLWRIDLNTDADPLPAEQLYKCHAGAVMDIAPCPWGPYLASIGIDGRIQLYEYVQQQLLFSFKYPARGSSIIWLPLEIQISGDELILGFDDGNLRVIVLNIDEKVSPAKVTATTIQIIKPHNRPVTKITINESGSVLVTGGEDATIFIFKLAPKKDSYVTLVPIGYIRVPGTVTYLTWHHELENVVLAGCIHGDFVQVEVPTNPQKYTTITYILYLEPLKQKFTTYKSQIRRDIVVAAIEARKAIKLEKKVAQLEQIKKDNPGLDIDEEVFLADSESEEVLEPLFIPEIPNRVLWLRTTEENTIWLSMAGFDAGYIYEYDINQTEIEPQKYQIIYNGDDIEISSHLYSKNQEYLFLAMQDGSIRVVKVNPEDWRDWSDYWQLSMHDNINGFIPKMCFNHDGTYFFSCGYDGNIFSYKFFPEEEENYPEPLDRIPTKVQMPQVEDEDGYKKLSLEEAIVKAELDRQLRVANQHKAILREKLSVLKERFQSVLKRNSHLPLTQIIPREELELDERITRNLEERLEADLALVKRKLAYRVEKSFVAMQKLKDHFSEPANYFPIKVEAIRKNKIVDTARQRKLTGNFDNIMEFVLQKMIEDELKGRPPERIQVVVEAVKPPEKKEKQLEYFLVGLSPSTIRYKLGAILSRLLNKYRARKAKIEKRQEEWDAFNALKPAEGVNDPEDENILNEAIQTIGDFKLKSASDYKVPAHLKMSTVKKYKQLLATRMEQYELRYDFNTKLYTLRDEKVELRNFLLKLQLDIELIHEEISEEFYRVGPPIPEITDNDFLEKHLEVVVEVPDPSSTPKEAPPKRVTPKPKGDLLEKEVLMSLDRLKQIAKVTGPELPNEFLDRCEDVESPWEKELLENRKARKLFDQDYIIAKMNRTIDDFDQKLIDLFEHKLKVSVDMILMDLHNLTLNQELIVLKDFESIEDQLQAKVHAKWEELLDMQDLIRDLNNKIEVHKRNIEELQETEKEIQQQFLFAITDNKFYDFLRRIFKKKYKPPKIHGPDESSSSDESSSDSEDSEEADAGSIDSKDFGIIRLDENVCPKGCDPNIYNMTFELRTKRHGVELNIKDQQTSIAGIKKEIDIDNKKYRVIQMNLNTCQEELEAYQRLKQRKLNEIMCTIILKLNQVQNLESDSEAFNVKDSLIFTQATVSRLYRRVGELYNETIMQKEKHKSNITHLCRMKTDCKHMELTIEKLKAQVIEEMKIRFGREIDVDELEEAQLKRMIMVLRLSRLDVKGLYEEELRMWKVKFGEKQAELARCIQDNTARFELLGMLNREKTELANLIASQARKREHFEKPDGSDKYKEDLQTLTNIVKKQCSELLMLKAEIRRMSMKGIAPPKIDVAEEVGGEEEEELVLADYSYDSFQMPEMPKKEPKTFKLRVEPELSAKEIENMARMVILEMLESLESFDEMSRSTMENFVDEILHDVLNRQTVADILDNLLALLPIDELNDEQLSIVQASAEQIFALQTAPEDEMTVEKESEEDSAEIEAAQKEAEDNKIMIDSVLNTIIDETLLTAGAPYDVIADMIKELIKQLPINYLLEEQSICSIVGKIKGLCGDITQDEFLRGLLAQVDSKTEEVRLILDKILEAMFGYGIDYLYYIKY